MTDELTLDELQERLSNSKNSIQMFEDVDGNWRGFTHKNGKLVQVRVVDPGTALQELITHP